MSAEAPFEVGGTFAGMSLPAGELKLPVTRDGASCYGQGMSYTLKDVDAAERRLKSECPWVVTSRTDYDFSLSVKKNNVMAFVVFRAERPKIGQSEYVAPDLGKIIEALTDGRSTQ